MGLSVSAGDILSYLDAAGFDVSFEGEAGLRVHGFCSARHPKDGSVTWVKEIEGGTLQQLSKREGCLVVAKEGGLVDKGSFSYIVTEEPKAVFFSILEHFWGEEERGLSASNAVIKSQKIAEGVLVGDNCFIDEDVSIGSGTVIEPNVTILHHVEIGKNCIVHAGAVIGADGYGYFMGRSNVPEKVRHFGGVVIEDGVEVGANVCIDRGTIDDTFIGRNTKIDNLVHIAHNVQIQEASMIVAGAVICGSAQLGRGSYIAPGGIVRNQVAVGTGGFLGLGAVAVSDVPEDTVVAGIPARPVRRVEKGDK